MSDYLLNAYTEKKRDEVGTNPYLSFGRALSGNLIPMDQRDPYASAITNIILNALGGLAGGYGKADVDATMGDFNQRIATALASPDGLTKASLADDVLKPYAGNLSAYDEALRQQQNEELRDFDQKINMKVAEALIALKAKNLDQDQTEQRLLGKGQSPQPMGELGYESPENEIKRIAREYQIETGATPTASLAAARNIYAPKLKSLDASYKTADTVRAKAEDLALTANKIKGAIQSGAYTGWLGGVNRFANRLIDPDEAAQQDVFSEILPIMVAEKRPPGAFTEREWNIIAESSPALHKSEAENMRGLKVLETAALKATMYADLLDTTKELGLTKNKADQIWSAYRKKFGVDPYEIKGHWSEVWQPGEPLPALFDQKTSGASGTWDENNETMTTDPTTTPRTKEEWKQQLLRQGVFIKRQ